MREKVVKVCVCGAFPGKIGGTTVIVQQLFNDLLKCHNYQTTKCDFTEIQSSSNFGRIAIIWETLKSISKSDISVINVSKRGFEILIVPVALACVFTKKKAIIRYFGGDATEIFSKFPKTVARLIHYVTKTNSIIATETIQNIAHFEGHGYTTYQLTNSRPKTNVRQNSTSSPSSLALIFIAQLKTRKGVKDIIEAVSHLDNVKVDFYGPMEWDIGELDFRQKANVIYKGTIPIGSAQSVMASYDALIFPTTYEGESHAGVVLEAYSVGLPVIAYRWKAMPEIIFEGETGLLSTCGDINQLRESIKYLRDDKRKLMMMSQNCLRVFTQHFTSEASIRRLTSIIDYQISSRTHAAKPSKWQIKEN